MFLFIGHYHISSFMQRGMTACLLACFNATWWLPDLRKIWKQLSQRPLGPGLINFEWVMRWPITWWCNHTLALGRNWDGLLKPTVKHSRLDSKSRKGSHIMPRSGNKCLRHWDATARWHRNHWTQTYQCNIHSLWQPNGTMKIMAAISPEVEAQSQTGPSLASSFSHWGHDLGPHPELEYLVVGSPIL